MSVLEGLDRRKVDRVISQIRKYETDVTQPSIDAIKKLAIASPWPPISSSSIRTNASSNASSTTTSGSTSRPLARLDPDERQLVKGVHRSVVLKHDISHSGLARTC
jgi:hypothetical protein